MEGYIAEIRLFAGTFAPKDWAYCQGQILPIQQNSALYSLVGITYGGNGSTTFALPDLRGRVAVGTGQGQNLSNRILGQMGGEEIHVMSQAEMPMHSHMMGCHNSSADQSSPMGTVLSTESGSGIQIYSGAGPNAVMHPSSVQIAGSSLPFNQMQPFLAMNYIICLYGIYPTRN